MKLKSGQKQEDVEMSFLDHLEALRWHIIRSGASILIFAVIAFLNKHFIFDVVFLGPTHTDFWTYRMFCKLGHLMGAGDDACVKSMGFKLINTEMAGQFTQHISMSITLGIVMAFPYAAWELWRFFRPALTQKEKRYTRGIVGASTTLFIIGILFGYFGITPVTIQFLGSYSISDTLVNFITVSDYIDTVTMTTISIAITFELPIVVYFLSKAGILTPTLMRQYRKHAIVIILILAAVITPTTDMLTMTLVAIPFYALYEASIFVAYIVARNKKRRELYEDSISE
jgi:sec-independent protein translocase protein TatC